MFRAVILPIFSSTRLCVTACGIMHRRCCQPAASSVHYTTNCNTQSSAPEDGRNYRPKHVVLIGIINKPLLLHLVGCLYYYILAIWAFTCVSQNKLHYTNISQNFLLADPFWLWKTTTDPYDPAYLNVECLDDRYPELKFYISELILDSSDRHQWHT